MLTLYESPWIFVVITVINSIVYTFLYNKGKGFMLTVLYLHATTNATLALNVPVHIWHLLIKWMVLGVILIGFWQNFVSHQNKVQFSQIMERLDKK